MKPSCNGESGVLTLRRLGITESVAMKISVHKTRSVFEGYNIVDARDVKHAIAELNKTQNSQAIFQALGRVWA
jgi:hypothetical protein